MENRCLMPSFNGSTIGLVRPNQVVAPSAGRTVFQKVRPNRAYHTVARQIEETIVSGRLKPGDRLPAERELIHELDVSRRTLREALRLLEQKGLVKHTIKPVGRKERKVYELTEEGKEFCTRLFKRFAALVTTAIEPSLNVCAHCGCKVYEGGHKETVNGEETMFCCKHCAASYKQEMGKRI